MTKRVTDWNPGWRTKVAAAAVGGVTALFSLGSPEAYGWWGSIICAAGALILPTLAFQRLWSRPRFWVIFALLGVLQVPLVIVVRGFVEQFRLIFMLGFGAVDCIFVISMIYYLCPDSLESRNH